MKKFFGEFRDFALRGNVMDLAVGVIIGAAFQSVVTSLTDNILSPIIGLFTRQNFDDLMLRFFQTDDGSYLVTIKYGAFITTLINFIIMAFVIFLLVRGMNRLAGVGKPKKNEVPGAPKVMTCPYCLTEIPYGASRCPNCTAEISSDEREKAEQAAKAAAQG